MTRHVVASIPSPSSGQIHLGPLAIHAYGFCIAGGVLAAVWLANKRFVARGGEPGAIASLAAWAVPGGLIGARIYHVVTDYQLYTHNPVGALKIWGGGLGIWGGIAGGVLTGLWVARRRGYPLATLLEVVAPALPLAQAIGRWGNYFNQELFGRPTSLPWGLRIDLAHRPTGYERFATFHPTFLYESLWDLLVVGVVLLAERRLKLRPGRLFAVYVAAYTLGRFWTEWLRIDPAHRIGGLRINDWVSAVVFVVATAIVVTGRRRESTPEPETAGLAEVEEEVAPHGVAED
jgi:prolipoprotein diacylglyceryl transferase